MGLKERDIKLLWGRAGGKCAFPECRKRLSEDKTSVAGSFPIGEQAHIVAEEASGPRGKSILTAEERNSYSNTILLCPTHHTEVDKNPDDYPIEKLHLLKRNHELFIEANTSEPDLRTQASAEIYSALVDAAVEDCRLANWTAWAGWVMATERHWAVEGVESVHRFRERVLRAAWPGTNPELEKALQTLSMTLHTASHKFMEHVEEDREENTYRGVWFYKSHEYPQATYDRLLKEFERWIKDCDDLIIEATKAANWVADIVRRDLNPMFFAVQGRFVLTYQQGLRFTTSLFTYTEEEKLSMPAAFMNRINSMHSDS